MQPAWKESGFGEIPSLERRAAGRAADYRFNKRMREQLGSQFEKTERKKAL